MLPSSPQAWTTSTGAGCKVAPRGDCGGACSLCQHFLEAQHCCSIYYYYPCDYCYLLLTLLCVPGYGTTRR
ncbi:guanine deaminase [Anopheles sinensis]|uniref:Guanine deaminase n=1 Tax=Anopheles sinensis TaxID=74873 RepID=A0A084W585_ANOSI|nr:guanine deaminase [Anopheles sinensis]